MGRFADFINRARDQARDRRLDRYARRNQLPEQWQRVIDRKERRNRAMGPMYPHSISRQNMRRLRDQPRRAAQRPDRGERER